MFADKHPNQKILKENMLFHTYTRAYIHPDIYTSTGCQLIVFSDIPIELEMCLTISFCSKKIKLK